ncbi:MAG: purine-nucleoside phosphorylase [Bacteroidetes bacterium]|nr:purine-nucleoside phosphorylase [Bacteroidota bacterium]
MPELHQALSHIRQFTDLNPSVGLILGSGLSMLADLVHDPVSLETSTIPNYPPSTVEGHVGRLVFGSISGVSVVFVQGRLHVYEGHSVSNATFPVRLLSALGVRRLIVTNAAGGIHPDFKPGTLMWITDHINWTNMNPLIGSRKGSVARAGAGAGAAAQNESGNNYYDSEWTNRARAIGNKLGISTSSGTYLWTRGPSYETKAEIQAFKLIGADAVGMSTVPEVVQARACGMKVLGLSTITNLAAGLGDNELNHEEVLDVGRQVRSDLERLILALIAD